MIIDKLYDRVEKYGVVCVGLDTSLDYIPQEIKDKYPRVSDQIFHFNKEIIDGTLGHVAIYKLQIAYYEANGLEGLMAYKRTIDYLKEKDQLVIGDVKRSDIAATAKEYGRAHFEGDFEVDFITLNPYMGFDSISPYLKYLESGQKGIFVLLRTSNPGAKDIEYLEYQGDHLYYHIGDRLNAMGKDFVGKSGYSSLGLVVGGTHGDEASEIRKRYKDSFFLIPGYGAQGGKAEDIRKYLEDFNGGIVNSSRSIIRAYEKHPDGKDKIGYYARQAVLKMKEDIYEKSL